DKFHYGNLRQCFGRFIAVNGKGQSTPHPRVAEGLLFVVQGYQNIAGPWTLLHDRFVAEGFDHVIPRRRVEAAEFHGHLAAAHRGDSRRRITNEYRPEAVEIGTSRHEIV